MSDVTNVPVRPTPAEQCTIVGPQGPETVRKEEMDRFLKQKQGCNGTLRGSSLVQIFVQCNEIPQRFGRARYVLNPNEQIVPFSNNLILPYQAIPGIAGVSGDGRFAHRRIYCSHMSQSKLGRRTLLKTCAR